MGFGAQFVLPQQTILDSNGAPVSGAKVYFYDAGTTDEQTVYTDSGLSITHTQPVVADAGGRLAPIFVSEGSYKVVVTDADDVTIYTEDSLKAPKDGALVSLTFARPQTPVRTITSATTLVYPDDFGKLVEADTTGGGFTITLPTAASVGNGGVLEVIKRGASGTATIKASSTDKIKGTSGVENATYQIAETGASVRLTSTGAGWTAIGSQSGVDSIADGSISIGKLGASVTSRLASVGDLKEKPYGATPDDGWKRCDGSAISRTTYADLFAKIGTLYGDGDGSTTFNLPDYRGAFRRMWDNGAGIDPDASSRAASTVPGVSAGADEVTGDAVGSRQASSNKSHAHTFSDSGTTSTTGAHTHGLGRAGNSVAVDFNDADGNVAGTNSSTTHSAGNHSHTFSVSGTTSSSGGNESRPYNVYVDVHIFVSEDEASGASASFQTLLNGAGAPNEELGNNGDFYLDTDSGEIYGPKASDTWIDTNVPYVGHAGVNYKIDTSATDGTGIESGGIQANNADWSLATTLYIADTDRFDTDRSDFISAIESGGRIVIRKAGDPNKGLWYDVAGAPSDQTTYYSIAVSHRAGDYAPSDDDAIFLIDQDTGADGADGADGAVGTVSAAGDGTEAAPGIAWAADSNTGFRRTASGETRYVADGADAVQINGDGVELLASDSFLTVPEHASAPGTPATGKVVVYAKADGKLYIKDGGGAETDLTAAGGGGTAATVQVFTSPGAGTWTKPAGLVYAVVECVGGGGGGGSAAATTLGNSCPAGGGAGGDWGLKRILAASLGATEPVTIGAGGAGALGSDAASGLGPTASSGGTSSFGTHLSCAGGGPGQNSSSASSNTAFREGGAGANTISGADVSKPGAAGLIGIRESGNAFGGQGGDSPYGSGGKSPFNFLGTSSANDGLGYGAGGSGASGGGGSAAVDGGDGTGGIVIVWEYY